MSNGLTGSSKDSIEARFATLEREVQSLRTQMRQVPSRFPHTTRNPTALEVRIRQVAHGLHVGDVVYGKWNGTETVYELGWGFSGLAHADDGYASIGSFGVVSAVVTVDSFTVITEGWCAGLTQIDTEAPLDPATDGGADLYLTEDVDNPGMVSRYRTASGIRIGTYWPGAGGDSGDYQIGIFRDSAASFAVVTLNFSSLSITLPGGVPVVSDDGVAAVAAADYTANPDPKYLRLAWCKYSPTQTVVVVHGKVWRGLIFTGTSPAWKAGPVYLSTAGDVEFSTNSQPFSDSWSWNAGHPGKDAPKIHLGYYDGGTGLFFDPRREPGLYGSWDLVPKDSIEPVDIYADGDVPTYDSAIKRWRSKQPASGVSAFTGPGVLGVPSGLALPTAVTGSASQVLAISAGGVMGFAKIVAANITAHVISATELAQATAYTVVGNGTSATANATGITASADGTVLNRKGTVLDFVPTMELGTAAAGGGTFKVNFAAGKYISVDASGNIDLFQSATARVQIGVTGTVTITYGSSNTVVISASDFVGSSKAVKLRELDICDATGAAKKILALCSAAY